MLRHNYQLFFRGVTYDQYLATLERLYEDGIRILNAYGVNLNEGNNQHINEPEFLETAEIAINARFRVLINNDIDDAEGRVLNAVIQLFLAPDTVYDEILRLDGDLGDAVTRHPFYRMFIYTFMIRLINFDQHDVQEINELIAPFVDHAVAANNGVQAVPEAHEIARVETLENYTIHYNVMEWLVGVMTFESA
jgi:hypothetical protein